MYNNVLVAVELGDVSARQVLDAARELVGPDAERHLLYVIDLHNYAYYLDPLLIGDLSEKLHKRVFEGASTELAKLCQPFRIAPDNQRVVAGDPASQIQATAQQLGCDLIVMGSHGSRGWRRLLGSTANQVLHGTPIDVYLVKVSPPEAVV